MNHRRHGPSARPEKKPPLNPKLSQQYGGRHTAGWVNFLPSSWIPYIQLARLSPPVDVCLVFFPHVFGFLHGTLLLQMNPSANFTIQTASYDLIRAFGFLLVGSFFLSNAIHGWNDLIDAPYDALVARTRERPIVRGAVSKTGALLFTISQGATGFFFLVLLLPNPQHAVRIAGPSVLGNLYYPFAKRHTHFAQYVLGMCLAWGVVIGTAGVLETAGGEGRGWDVWSDERVRASSAALTAAAAIWTVIYDTIYAFQDREDDVKVGLKSTAVMFGQWTKMFLAVNLTGLATLLWFVGAATGLRVVYLGVAVGGCLMSLGTMIRKVDLRDPGSCWWWFRYGFWLAGGSITTGLLLECVLVAVEPNLCLLSKLGKN